MELDICVDVPLCSSLKRVFSQLSMGVLLLFFVSICGAAWGTHLPLPSCDSSSIWVRRLGWDAALLVIASEMNYLADSETGEGEEIVIELPPHSLPGPYTSSYYICSAEGHFPSAHRHTKCSHPYKTNSSLSPARWPQQSTILMQGDFIDWLFTGTCTLGHCTLSHSYSQHRDKPSFTHSLSLHLLVLLCSKYSPIWGAL